MKELPYFKFFPGEWLKGDITMLSKSAQGLFINICVYYWMKGCNMSLTGVQHRFNDCLTELEQIIKSEIITVDNDEIYINFLDEQFEQFAELSKKKSRAGKASAKMRKINRRSTDVHQVVNKEDKDKDKDKDKEIPTYEVFKKYALEKQPNVDELALKLKFESWIENGWMDGNNKKIINWKTKLLNTLPHIKVRESKGSLSFRPLT